MNRRTLLKLSAAAMAFPMRPAFAQDITHTIRDAYIYTYPLVKNYLTLYQYAVERDGGQYKGPFNTVASVARVYTPEDTAIITPNSDTPYSFIVFDLRAEPVVVTMPKIEQDRYYSLQLVDLYTNNVDYPGTRMDGNDGGDFLITGPDWGGDAPAGITRIIKMPTWLGLGVIRTQLFSPDDLDAVKEIQAGYKSQPLSTWADTAAPPAAEQIDWRPVSDALMESDFWSLADFLLPFAPAWLGDEAQRDGLTRLGVTGAGTWPPADLSPDTVAAMRQGIQTTYQEVRDAAGALTDSSKIFGTPVQMQGQYLTRAAAAQGGIYGNSAEEALYVIQVLDGDGVPMDGSKGSYGLTFAPDGLPPVDAFWSLTMYDRENQLLVANPIGRYLINSAMLEGLKRDDQGNITLYLQTESPGSDLESNWLPTPTAPFYTVMRLYLPQDSALNGNWIAPPIRKRS
ncbi:DUF1254 domain-containing protein [Paracoccus methylovorus]|uniref:DUF1254 domain-containing protein n=1 Tax=Paracoccus methylovorus TaxID=2812658 RepID=A0ABX7JF99_9RHOB|nr:DUF1254 domain-containing protein [Paracoccus methylovorus]QRZ12870.1 DUF1254 domain-containing protein [Paracoccus methylovorus]